MPPLLCSFFCKFLNHLTMCLGQDDVNLEKLKHKDAAAIKTGELQVGFISDTDTCVKR